MCAHHGRSPFATRKLSRTYPAGAGIGVEHAESFRVLDLS